MVLAVHRVGAVAQRCAGGPKTDGGRGMRRRSGHPCSGPQPAPPVHGRGTPTLEIRDTDGMYDLQDKLDELGARARVLEGDERCATGVPHEGPGSA